MGIAYKLIDRYQYARKAKHIIFQKINYEKLRLILGDQLNSEHSWFKQIDNDTVYSTSNASGNRLC
jgi:hypothetical protein